MIFKKFHQFVSDSTVSEFKVNINKSVGNLRQIRQIDTSTNYNSQANCQTDPIWMNENNNIEKHCFSFSCPYIFINLLVKISCFIFMYEYLKRQLALNSLQIKRRNKLIFF